MEIKTIQPKIFSRGRAINAFFTLKNDQLYQSREGISGLNLGFTNNEAPEITEQNRNKLLNAFNIDPNWIAFANQVHSNRVKVVTNGGTFAKTDGLITQIPGLALAVQVADCAAILVADSKSKTIAAIHAGWRGAAGAIVPRTLQKMHQLGTAMESCRAFISPCISRINFEVGQEVADQFPDPFVDTENLKKPHIDLKGFLAHQLQQEGLPPDRIEIHPGCTVAEQQFYSYRREKAQSGRMMGIIRINK